MQHKISCMVFSVGSYLFQIPVAELLKKNHDDPLASHGGIHTTLKRFSDIIIGRGWLST